MRAALIFLVVLCLLAASASAEVKGVQISPKLINQNPDPVEPGDDVELRFRIDNNISGTIDTVEVELLPKYPFIFSEPAIKNIGSLDASQKGADAVVVKYKVSVDKDADEGAYPIYLRYRVGKGSWVRQSFEVNVEAAEAILGIESVESGGFSAGNTAGVMLLVRNFGKSLVKEVRVSVNLNSIPFSPAGTSNEKVISSILPGELAKAEFQLVADADADSGYYKTDVVLKYLDDSGNSYVKNSTIGLLVYDKPEFTLSLKETKVSTSGSNGEVVLSISNTGPSDIRFVNVELIETGDYKVLSSPRVYVGNLEADDLETVEFDIRTSKTRPKDVNLRVRFAYKDALNMETVKEEVVGLRLYSKSDAKRFGLVSSQQNMLFVFVKLGIQIVVAAFVIFMLIDCWKNKLPKYKKVLWMAVVVTGIGAVLYYFLARRKK